MPDSKPGPAVRIAQGIQQAEVTRFEQQTPSGATRIDCVIVEEPLKICIAGDAFVTTMRTPGHDHELTAGLLVAEGLIRHRDALGAIRHCDPGPDPKNNTIDVLPAPGTVLDTVSLSARVSLSSCGLCGREQIADLLQHATPSSRSQRWRRSTLHTATARLSQHQHNYHKTGGGHAAAAVSAEGEFLCLREDVGRHNAVDKVVGRLLLDDQLPAAGVGLLVSGRVSFEIVQKAVLAGFELVIGVSAPSSLSIATASEFGLTLVGFSRAASFNVYTGAEWLDAD